MAKERMKKNTTETVEAKMLTPEYLSDLLDNSFDFVTILDEKMKFIWANKIWYKKFGSEPAKLNVMKPVHPDDVQMIINEWKKLVTVKNNIRHVRYRYMDINGKYLYVETNAKKVTVDGKDFFYITTKDISEQKYTETKREKELLRLKNELAIKVKKRTEELEEKINELSRLNNLMIGRELKMMELKKEILELKSKLNT